MGTKNNPGKFDCYAEAEPDEPMFILLGRDKDAPEQVRRWAVSRAQRILAGDKPARDWPMIGEAFTCAEQMERFRELREASKRK
jgi:hypothetical protein